MIFRKGEKRKKVDDVTKKFKGGFLNQGTTIESSFTIYGSNARSAFKEQNVYFIKKFLAERNPDFLLLNETGVFKKKIEKSVQQYKSFHEGTSLGIFYKRGISVTPIWREMCSNYAMIVKVTLNKRSMIILNTYRSPSHPEDTYHITSIVE